MRWIVLLSLALCGMGECQDKPSTGSGSSKSDAEEVVDGANKQLSSFGQQVKPGVPTRGVRIPSFANGRLGSLIEADSLTKLDEERLFAENMTIQTYEADGREGLKVEMLSSTFNMTSQIMRSQERSRVSRVDFEMEGDSMVFDTATSQGKMVGNVKMIIFDSKSFLKIQEPAGKVEGEGAPAGSNEAAGEGQKTEENASESVDSGAKPSSDKP